MADKMRGDLKKRVNIQSLITFTVQGYDLFPPLGDIEYFGARGLRTK